MVGPFDGPPLAHCRKFAKLIKFQIVSINALISFVAFASYLMY